MAVEHACPGGKASGGPRALLGPHRGGATRSRTPAGSPERLSGAKTHVRPQRGADLGDTDIQGRGCTGLLTGISWGTLGGRVERAGGEGAGRRGAESRTLRPSGAES